MARSALGCLLLAGSLAGVLQSATTVSGPLAGYVVSVSGRELRAVLGVPGSFRFSEPLDLPRQVTGIHLAPTHTFAVVERGTAGLAILPLEGGADQLIPVEGAAASADWVAFSPSARSAILYSAAGNRVQVISGLPGSPRVLLEVDAASLPAGLIRGAISDDGSIALVASSQAVYSVAGDGPPRLLLSAGQVTSMAMLRNGAVAVADRSTGAIHMLRNIEATPVRQVLVSAMEGLEQLYPSADGSAIFAARPASNLVSLVNTDTGEVRDFEAGTSPLSLIPMRNRDTFLISAERGEPGWIFYREGNGARAVFVPAIGDPAESPRTRRRQ